MASDFSTGQVTVQSTSATEIVTQNTGRKAVLVTNLGAVDVYIGDSSAVTTSTGQLLPGTKGASISIPTTGTVWAIAASSTQDVSFMSV